MIFLLIILTILFLFSLFLFLLLLSNIQIEIKDLDFDSSNKKNYKLQNYVFFIRLKLFGKITILKIRIKRYKVIFMESPIINVK